MRMEEIHVTRLNGNRTIYDNNSEIVVYVFTSHMIIVVRVFATMQMFTASL